MTPDQLASNVEDIILKAIDDFNEGLQSSQVNAYNTMVGLIKELDLDRNGNIKRTASNVRKLRGITKSIEDTLLTDTYKKRVSKYIKSYDSVGAQQNLYFATIKKGFEVAPTLEIIKNEAVDSVVSSLTETGLQEYFSAPIKNILYRNISTGGSFSSMQEELRTHILGTAETDGAFLKYTKQITSDSLSGYNATYNNAVSKDLGLVFYKYTGSSKDTTREFCLERKNKFYHIEEVKNWGNGEKCCGLHYPVKKNGKPSWPGMRKGTNENNIITFRGGYSCMHQLIAVSQGVVPDEVVKRAKEKGYLR